MEFFAECADTCSGKGPPVVMGVLNVTPDSFSDGGVYLDTSAAVDRAEWMVDQGARVVDVGAESTRPGAEPVSAREQIARAVPVIRALRRAHRQVVISIDTRLAAVADAALDAGAELVNDVSALRDDPELGPMIARRGAGVVLMHMQGQPQTMQTAGGGPRYDDVVAEVKTFLAQRLEWAESVGIDRSRIVLDPGLGFGKTVQHNLALLARLDEIVSLGSPVLIGASRKSFVGQVTGVEVPAERLAGSLACAVWAAVKGASIIRVHDVAQTIEALRMIHGLRGAGGHV